MHKSYFVSLLQEQAVILLLESKPHIHKEPRLHVVFSLVLEYIGHVLQSYALHSAAVYLFCSASRSYGTAVNYWLVGYII